MSGQRYLVTARKYRPQTFGELVAQEHVAETLKNAIRLDRLAHAYLFSGPRGVGKTTAARILAKAINCTTPPEERVDAAEPCRQCDSCRSFEEGRNLNIIEIDAASNNKVEDVRDLRDTVRIPPQGSRKKVYIVDEVHMLSNAAFNALLKTLEEPPPYVLFIFATTEPHKVLPTILSRCQRFDFRRIAVPDIVAQLEHICREENITADEASLMLLARKADGALRDALSAFDQAVSLCGADLVYTELARALGVVDVDLFFEATGYVAEQNSAGMLRLVDHLVRFGFDLQEFLGGLAEHLRNMLVARTVGDASLIEATEATRQRYAGEAERFQEADLLRLLLSVGETHTAIHNRTQPRLKLETGLLKMVGLSRAVDLRQALDQLERLEALARDGKFPADAIAPAPNPAPAAPERPSPPPAKLEVQETPSAYRSDVEPVQRTSTIHQMPRPGIRPMSPGTGDLPPQPAAEAGNAGGEETRSDAASPEPAAAPAIRPSAYAGLGAPALKLARPPRDARADLHNEPNALFAGSGALATVLEPAPAPSLDHLFEPICAAWPQFVADIKTQQIRLGAMLAQGTPVALEGETLVIGVPDDFHRRALEGEHPRLHRHFTGTVNESITALRFIVHREPPSPEAPGPETEADPAQSMKRRREEDPVVRAIFDHFGGEIVW